MPNKQTPGKVRRADNGQYATPDYGKKHPNTTVTEHDKPSKKK